MINKNMFGVDWGAQVDKTNDPYNLNNAGQYGLKKYDKKDTSNQINSIAQRQIDRDSNRAFRQGLAGGDTNPEVGMFDATQSARDSRDRALVGENHYANEDQYRQMNSLLGIESSKQNRDNLNFQKEQYNDSKPGFWDDFLAVGGVISDAIPFFPDGGVVQSQQIVQGNDGQIPQGAQNTQPNQIHNKPVNIQAEEGERIMSQTANNMFGNELMAIENKAQQASNGMQGDGLQGAHGYAGQNGQGAQGAGQSFDIQGLAKNLINRLQTFANGGTVQPQQQMGGDYSEGTYNQYTQDKSLFDEYANMPQIRKSNLAEEELLKYQTAINQLQSNPFNQNTPEAQQWKDRYQNKVQPTMGMNNTPQGQQGLNTQTDFSHATQAQPQMAQQPNGEEIFNNMFKPKPQP